MIDRDQNTPDGDTQSSLELNEALVPTSDHESYQQELNIDVNDEIKENESTRKADLGRNSNTTSSTSQRTSSRTSRPPIWMKDYVPGMTKFAHPHFLANYMSYGQLSSNYQAYLSNISSNTEPNNYEEVVKDLRWMEAMKQEIHTLEANGT